jgi:hypothetical protein
MTTPTNPTQPAVAEPKFEWPHLEVGGPYPSVSIITTIDYGCGGPDPEPPSSECIAMLDMRSEGTPDVKTLAMAQRICECFNALSGIPSPAAFVERARRIEVIAKEMHALAATWIDDSKRCIDTLPAHNVLRRITILGENIAVLEDSQ